MDLFEFCHFKLNIFIKLEKVFLKEGTAICSCVSPQMSAGGGPHLACPTGKEKYKAGTN